MSYQTVVRVAVRDTERPLTEDISSHLSLYNITMPSLEGLKTWFDYEIVIIALAILCAILLWGAKRLVKMLINIPLTTTEFVLYTIGISLSVTLLMVLLAQRYR